MKRILLISAHPDDMEIGMGGTAAKLAQEGHSIVSIVITDGRRSPDPDSIGQDKMARLRKVEGERACVALGISETQFFGFETVATEAASSEATQQLVKVVDQFRPDEVFTLHPELDRHASHRSAATITVDAVRRTNSDAELWAYEVWGLFPAWDRFEDISDQLETKIAAIKQHRSQIAAVQYEEGIEGLNRWRAVFADPHQEKSPAKYAEVFIRLR